MHREKAPKIIKSISELRDICHGEPHNFSIILRYGGRSSKEIEYDAVSEVFLVFNEIDGTSEEFTAKELNNPKYTNIGRAIKRGALVMNY